MSWAAWPRSSSWANSQVEVSTDIWNGSWSTTQSEITGPECYGWLINRMPASNTYKRSASLALLCAGTGRASSVIVLSSVLAVIGAYCFCPTVFAQTSDFRTAEEPSKTWTATTDLKSGDTTSQHIPVRIIESHSENGNRTLDKRSVEIRETDGHFDPYQDVERETLTVDASTVRTTMR